jgi:hypothetical protein
MICHLLIGSGVLLLKYHPPACNNKEKSQKDYAKPNRHKRECTAQFRISQMLRQHSLVTVIEGMSILD